MRLSSYHWEFTNVTILALGVALKFYPSNLNEKQKQRNSINLFFSVLNCCHLSKYSRRQDNLFKSVCLNKFQLYSIYIECTQASIYHIMKMLL